MIFSLLYYSFVAALFSFFLFLVSFYIYNRSFMKWCQSTAKLNGKTVVVTGASAGIGKEAAKDFARRGAKVILACRNKSKAQRIADDIIATTGNKNVHVRIIDTSSLSSVRSFAKEFRATEDRLDILVLNAGIGGPSKKISSEDGLEGTMATNHFGHFLLVNLLADLLEKSKPSRIVVTSSRAHTFIKKINPKDLNFDTRYSPMKAYSQSKICNVYMTKSLAEYFYGKGVTVNAMCPGLVLTEIGNKPNSTFFTQFFMTIANIVGRSEAEGAQTIVYLAVSEEVENKTGGFYIDCAETQPSLLSQDIGMRKKIWEASEEIVKLSKEERKIN